MRYPLLNPGFAAAIGYVLVVAILALFAWLWLGVFGFSFIQLAADLALVFGGGLLAGALSGPTLKKWNL